MKYVFIALTAVLLWFSFDLGFALTLPKVLLCVPKKHRVCDAASVVPLSFKCVWNIS